MKRGRLAMEPIKNEKACKATFENRKKGIMKKAYELATLCGVDACIIIYGPNNLAAQTWPQDPREVIRIIHKYEAKITDRPPKNYDLQDFFRDKRNKVEAETSKVHKETLRKFYPTNWDKNHDRYFSALGEDDLRAFVNKLDAKIDACNRRINMLKPDQKKAIASNPRSHNLKFLQSQASLSLAPINMVKPDQNKAISNPRISHDLSLAAMKPAFYYPSPLSQILHCDYQNYHMQMMMMGRNGRPKENGVENDESSFLNYHNGTSSVQTMQLYRHYAVDLQNLPPLPPGFQTDHGYYNMLQAQIPYYKH